MTKFPILLGLTILTIISRNKTQKSCTDVSACNADTLKIFIL